jgi:hypothetical protein
MPDDPVPVACNLTATAQQARQVEVAQLLAAVEARRELEDGYAFRFPGSEEWAARLLAFITAERRCCPFFTFDLRFEPEQGPIWLSLRGGEEVKRFVREWRVEIGD